MADLTAANVTVTLNPEDVDRSPDGRIGIRTFPIVQFGNGVLLYPALGIPMPVLGKFGFNFAIKRVYIEQPADGFIYHFDRANHKLRIYLGAGSHSHDLVIASNAVHTYNVGIGTLEANSSLSSNVANAVTIPGNIAANGGIANSTAIALAEIGAIAPAATILYMEMVGR